MVKWLLRYGYKTSVFEKNEIPFIQDESLFI